MIKKISSILLLAVCSITAYAQLQVGDWKIHSACGFDFQKVYDAGNKVYFIVSGNLFSYDKEEQITETYTKRNKLSDIGIENIYYNFDKKYLVIVYSNSNIDILFDDGRVENLSDIYTSTITGSKKINSVTFSGNNILLAADFGLTVVDDKKMEVRYSRSYNTPILAAGVVNGKLVIANPDQLYVAPFDKPNHSLDDFEATVIAGVTEIVSLEGDNFLALNNVVNRCTLTENNAVSAETIINVSCFYTHKSGDLVMGVMRWYGTVPFFDKEGKRVKGVVKPESIGNSDLVVSGNEGADYWVLAQNGVKNYKTEGNLEETVLVDWFKPDVSVVDNPYMLRYNEATDELYVMGGGQNSFLPVEYYTPSGVSKLKGSSWKDITPEITIVNPDHINMSLIRSPYSLVFDPDDPETYLFGSWFDGVYKIKDGKQVENYNWTNSPLVLDWYCLARGVQFDRNKNLWVMRAADEDMLCVLPRSKQNSPVTAADWKIVKLPGLSANHFSSLLITKKNDIKIFAEGRWGSKALAFIDDGSSIDVSSDDRIKIYTELIDQDEKIYNYHYIYCLTEDMNGKVWIGTDNGVVEVDPVRALSDKFRINHIKVPRNDGTSFADYLLENEQVVSIAVDPANRKWIGTLNSGVFLVSADGSEIIEQYNTSNSYLPSDKVFSIACNPKTNSVYFGTERGLAEYSSTASKSESDFSNVYAYPNPVRPGYTGWITVRGLMENTLVKITDATGNVVNSGVSTGGMYSWDGCYPDGKRVPTGVYYVLVSQGEESSKGAATKIMIIN